MNINSITLINFVRTNWGIISIIAIVVPLLYDFFIGIINKRILYYYFVGVTYFIIINIFNISTWCSEGPLYISGTVWSYLVSITVFFVSAVIIDLFIINGNNVEEISVFGTKITYPTINKKKLRELLKDVNDYNLVLEERIFSLNSIITVINSSDYKNSDFDFIKELTLLIKQFYLKYYVKVNILYKDEAIKEIISHISLTYRKKETELVKEIYSDFSTCSFYRNAGKDALLLKFNDGNDLFIFIEAADIKSIILMDKYFIFYIIKYLGIKLKSETSENK